MLNLKKLVLLVLATIGLAATAQSASAQTIYSTFTNNTGAVVTITNVSWTGSYYPRIEGTYAIGATGNGQHRMADARYSRYTSMSFRAKWTDDSGVAKTCLFSYDFRSDTGTFSTGGGYVFGGGAPTCGYTRSGYNFYFTPS